MSAQVSRSIATAALENVPVSAGLPRVQVLLATYNGERYLAEQLDSILSQQGVCVDLTVSDDGSTDRTPAMLLTYRERFPDQVTLLTNTGNSGHPKWNFLRLMNASDAAYVALADQDDVWLPDKLHRCVAAMSNLVREFGNANPLLVFTDMKVVDQRLNPVADSFWQNQAIAPERVRKLRNLLVQNVVAGCTILMNRSLVLACADMPSTAAMHDWWIALVASTMGHVEVLREQTVLYRQHDSNAVGAVLDHSRRLIPRPRFHALRQAQWETAAKQGAAFLDTFHRRLPGHQVQLLKNFVRCEVSSNRLVRVFTWLWGGFFQKGFRPNLAIFWYLWDMKAAKRQAAGVHSSESR